jgi:cyclopropane fatty-acyl-phospholipid synthase-like methyltransferase
MASTDQLLRRADLTAVSRVLDLGCGVATAAVRIARRWAARVTAVDVPPLMLERAEANVTAGHVGRGADVTVTGPFEMMTALGFPPTRASPAA